MLCARLDGREVLGRMDTCGCMAESLHCSPETTTTLLIGCIPIQNKKFKVWGEKICEPSASPSHENKMKGLKTTEGRCLKLFVYHSYTCWPPKCQRK